MTTTILRDRFVRALHIGQQNTFRRMKAIEGRMLEAIITLREKEEPDAEHVLDNGDFGPCKAAGSHPKESAAPHSTTMKRIIEIVEQARPRGSY